MKNSELKKICIGSDHAGFQMKEFIKDNLIKTMGYDVKDYGTNSEDSVDYPDYAHLIAQSIENNFFDRAIVICGSGNGVNMTVNKYPSVRSAICWNAEIAEKARSHNNANILALPARYIDFNEAWEIVKTFLNTEFEGGRHKKRIDQIPR